MAKAESSLKSGTERSEIANRRLPEGTRRGALATRKAEISAGADGKN